MAVSLWVVFFSFHLCFCDGAEIDNVIGESIDIFANYGDLSQMMQVISSDMDVDPNPVFTERTLRVFLDLPFSMSAPDRLDKSISFHFCDTFDDLMDNYYVHFEIDGTDKPWKSFMGDYNKEEILRNLGLSSELSLSPYGLCCFVLARMSKINVSVTSIGDEKKLVTRPYISEAVGRINANSSDIDIRNFMRSYGTHYISSYATGDSVYQVFVYTPQAYRAIKKNMRTRRNARLSGEDVRYFTSSSFLREIGRVMVASSNKTTEAWCNENLRDGHFLYTRPAFFRLYTNYTLLNQLSHKLGNNALLSMKLRSLSVIFPEGVSERFVEVADNDLKLWEVSI